MSIYAVNGKVPIAAWIPSRDTAGNGTTTLNDLVGTNHGTLTNMDAATDWVADTSNGGVRALDFDGVNDYVDTTAAGTLIGQPAQLTISCWIRWQLINSGFRLAISTVNSTGLGGWGIGLNTSNRMYGAYGNSFRETSAAMTLNAWVHTVFVATTVSGSTPVLYVNTTSQSGPSGTYTSNAGGTAFNLGRRSLGDLHSNCRLDDIRIFNSALTESDVAVLYNAGNGRGRITNNSTLAMGLPI
jgi:hypothetical protein